MFKYFIVSALNANTVIELPNELESYFKVQIRLIIQKFNLFDSRTTSTNGPWPRNLAILPK